MVVGHFLGSSLRDDLATRPIFSSLIALTGITVAASYTYQSVFKEAQMEFSLKKIRDRVDGKIFNIWEKFLDTCFVYPLKKFLPLGVESYFNPLTNSVFEQEAQEAFAKKGLSLAEIIKEAREVFHLKEDLKVFLEKSPIAAATSGINPKKITLNIAHIENKEDALFFLGHELGHAVEEDVLKSMITCVLFNVVSLVQIKKILEILDDKDATPFSCFLKQILLTICLIYLKDVQERHVEFRADRYGLFLLQAKKKLKNFISDHNLKIDPKEALDIALSWPRPPGLRESIHFRHEEGSNMLKNTEFSAESC